MFSFCPVLFLLCFIERISVTVRVKVSQMAGCVYTVFAMGLPNSVVEDEDEK